MKLLIENKKRINESIEEDFYNLEKDDAIELTQDIYYGNLDPDQPWQDWDKEELYDLYRAGFIKGEIILPSGTVLEYMGGDNLGGLGFFNFEAWKDNLSTNSAEVHFMNDPDMMKELEGKYRILD